MHMYYDSQYCTALIYPRFNIIRWIEFIFCIVCLILSAVRFDSNLDVIIKVITLSVSAAFSLICFFDVIAWLFRSPIGYAAWLMIALAAFLFFCLCGGCVLFLKRTTLVYYYYALCFFYIATALVFLFDYIWMAVEYINLRRCIKIGTKNKVDKGISACCVCKTGTEALPRRRSKESADLRGPKKIMYPSRQVIPNSVRSVPSQQKKNHMCGVSPRQKLNSYSTSVVYANEIQRKKQRMPQTLPHVPISMCDVELQEDEYELPLFKSEIADDPGPPYYLCNLMEKRCIPSKYYSTLDTVLERESRETSPMEEELTDTENSIACSSALSLTSTKSYQTSAASSIKKLFQTNPTCKTESLFDYQHPHTVEEGQEMRQMDEIPEMRRTVQSLKIKRSIETLAIKSNVEFPEIREIRGSDGKEKKAHSYLYRGIKRELVPRKLQSSVFQIETVKANLPSRIPIRPESKAVLKNSKTVLKKPTSSTGIVSRLQIRPESRVSPSVENKLNPTIENRRSPERVKSPWTRREKQLPKSNRSPRIASPQKTINQRNTRLSRPKSLSRLSPTSRKMANESNDNILDYISSGGDIASVDKYCPACRSLIKHSPPDSLEKKLSGLSSTTESLDSGRPMNFTIYDDGTCICKRNLGLEGR